MNNTPWKVLVVDDDEGIHSITRMVFRGYEFESREIELINASSSAQAKDILTEHSDIGVVLLDVVMETDNAGLNLVNYIRQEQANSDIRIILRTGHPGFAPEAEVIIDYDINDYLSKAELSASRLLTSVVVALRSYRDILSAKQTQTHQVDSTPRSNQRQTNQTLSDVCHFFEHKLETLQSLSEDLLALNHKPMTADIVTNVHQQCKQTHKLSTLLQPTKKTATTELVLCEILDALLDDYLNQAKREHWIADYQLSCDTPVTLTLENQWFSDLLTTLLEIAIYHANGNNIVVHIFMREQRLHIAIKGQQKQNQHYPNWPKALNRKLAELSPLYQGRKETAPDLLSGFSLILEQ